MQLLRHRMIWPGTLRQLVNLLKRELRYAIRGTEDEPVLPALVWPLRRWLVARPINEAEHPPVELGQRSGVGGVQHDLPKQRHTLVGHRHHLPPAILPDKPPPRPTSCHPARQAASMPDQR